MKNLIALFVTIAVSINLYSQDLNLSFNLKNGEIYRHLMAKKSVSENKFGDNENSSDVTTVLSITYKVLDYSQGKYTLEMKFDSLSTIIQSFNEQFYFNSESMDKEDIGNKLLDNIKNVEHILTFDKFGNNLNVTSDSIAQNKIFEELRSSQDRNMRRNLMQLRELMSSQQIQQMIEPLFRIYSENAISIGSSWKNEWINENRPAGKKRYDSLMELNDIDGNAALIVGDIRVESIAEKTEDGNKKPEKPQRGMRPNIEMQENYTLKYKVDLNSGWVNSLEIEGEASGSGQIPPNQMNPDGMSISISTRSIFQAFGSR